MAIDGRSGRPSRLVRSQTSLEVTGIRLGTGSAAGTAVDRGAPPNGLRLLRYHGLMEHRPSFVAQRPGLAMQSARRVFR